MKSVVLLLLTLLLLVTLVAAEAPQQDLYAYDDFLLKLTIENEVQITPQGGNPDVDEVRAELLWYPRHSYRQSPEDVVTSPAANDELGYQFHWVTPRTNLLSFSLTSLVRTSSDRLPVQRKIRFPIETLPSGIAAYTEPAELININTPISEKALELVAGTDDLFVAVYNVADWVTTNIEYNLTTMTASASQPSTWVMENREGVCDEMTSLFISMLRSLGIPARFVSGISYTNLPEFAEPWGGHGWAEVYFPGVGWVPFDVTYGTYGYVDATHIKLNEAFDAGGSSVEYTMRASNAGLVTKSLDMDVEILDKQELQGAPFTVLLEVFDDLIALDSHNLVTATITNNEDHYLSARLQLAQTQNIEVLNDRKRNVLLKPFESKKLTFLVRTRDLAPGYKYDFPVKLYVGLQEVAATQFTAREGMNAYSAAFFDSYMELRVEKPYNENIILDCTLEEETAYINDLVEARCTFTNNGRAPLNDVEFCIESCKKETIAPGEQTSFSTELHCTEPGVKSLMATATHRLLNSYGLIRYNCIDKAKIDITEVSAPSILSFEERGTISFIVEKASDTVPEEVTIRIMHDNFEQWWEAETLLNPQKFSYTIMGHHLDLEERPITISVTYKDKLGTEWTTEERVTVSLGETTFLQKIQLWLQEGEQWLSRQLGRV
jgi:transglutaminase-like putative cysteine protease